MTNNIKVGLVLAGGFARGALQAGYIKALKETSIDKQISVIASSSIGTVNAVAYATNDIDRYINLYNTLIDDNVFTLTKKMYKDKLLDKIVDLMNLDEVEFDLDIIGTLCRIPNFSAHYFNLPKEPCELRRKMIKANISFPILTGLGVKINKYRYLDGGTIDNVPLYPLINYYDLDLIIVLHSTPHYMPSQMQLHNKRNTKIIDIDICALADFRYSPFALKRKSLCSMTETGYKIGVKLFKELENAILADNLNNFISIFNQRQYQRRKNARDWFTLVEILNNMFNNYFL